MFCFLLFSIWKMTESQLTHRLSNFSFAFAALHTCFLAKYLEDALIFFNGLHIFDEIQFDFSLFFISMLSNFERSFSYLQPCILLLLLMAFTHVPFFLKPDLGDT